MTDSGNQSKSQYDAIAGFFKRNTVIGYLVVVFAVHYLFIKPIVLAVLNLAGPWRQEIVADLPDGSTAVFKSRRRGIATEDTLVLKGTDGVLHRYEVNGANNLYIIFARIWVSNSGRYLCLEVFRSQFERKGRVVATLDLVDDTFYFIDSGQPFAEIGGQFELRGEGQVGYWWEILLPL